MKCNLCKCLHLVEESKRHPSQTVWFSLLLLWKQVDDKKCEIHSMDTAYAAHKVIVSSYMDEVQAQIDRNTRAQSLVGRLSSKTPNLRSV